MLHLQIDPHSGVPVYRQIMNQLRYYVAAGTLAAGDRLPSIRALARRLAINPTTVVRAYTELQHEGAIDMQHGRGAFVTGGRTRLSAARRRDALRSRVRQLAVEARQLGAPDELLHELLTEELGRLEHEREHEDDRGSQRRDQRRRGRDRREHVGD